MPLSRLKTKSFETSATVTGQLGYTPIVDPNTGISYRQCQTMSDWWSYWLYSGNGGTRASAPTTLATETVFTWSHDKSSWKIANLENSGHIDQESADNFRWYQSRTFYIKAGTFSLDISYDDDYAIALVGENVAPVVIAGDVTDTDGSNAGSASDQQYTVTKSGIYKMITRGIDGGGGNSLHITNVRDGLELFYIPTHERAFGDTVNSVQHTRTDVITTTSQSGTTALESPTIKNTTYTSRYEIMAIVSGQSGDDSQTEWQYSKDNGSNWTSLGQMGDHSWSHRSNNGAMSLGYMKQFQPYADVGARVKVRGIIKSENNNQGGFHLNRGINDQPSGFNADGSTSTCILKEII